MNFPSGWELVLVVLVIVLLFGARKLPDAARGLGRSLRIFKSEIKDPNDEEGRDAEDELPTAAPQQQTITATPIAPPAPVVQPVPQPLAQQPEVPAQTPEQTPAQPPVQQTPTDR